MSIGDTGCMLTTSLPVYHSFFEVGKMMNSRWWNCEGRKFLPKDIVHPSNELVKRLQRGESPFRLSENLACVTWKDKKFAICCQTEGIRNLSSKKESQIRRPVVNKKLCSAKSNQNIVFLAIESANKAEINILSVRDTFNIPIKMLPKWLPKDLFKGIYFTPVAVSATHIFCHQGQGRCCSFLFSALIGQPNLSMLSELSAVSTISLWWYFYPHRMGF